MRAHGSQWISHKINIRHPEHLKKGKSWEPFWSYQLNSTANPAHLPQNWAKLAPRILIFSIAMDVDHSFYVKNIENHARTFLPLNIAAIGTVSLNILAKLKKKAQNRLKKSP